MDHDHISISRYRKKYQILVWKLEYIRKMALTIWDNFSELRFVRLNSMNYLGKIQCINIAKYYYSICFQLIFRVAGKIFLRGEGTPRLPKLYCRDTAAVVQ